MAPLENSGRLFDPDLVPRFVELLPDVNQIRLSYRDPAPATVVGS